MNRRFIALGGAVAMFAAAGALYMYLSSDSAAEQDKSAAEYTTLDAELHALIGDFNAAAGKTRLLFIVGPSCGPCLRGLDDMNRVVGDMVRDDPNLAAFVVYVPTLGAQEQHAARAVRLMRGEDIRHYWDPAGQSGVALQEALDVNIYAWDVWLIYDGEAVWTGSGPPAPVYWQHQLTGLAREQRLDPKRFAAKVAALLSKGESDG